MSFTNEIMTVDVATTTFVGGASAVKQTSEAMHKALVSLIVEAAEKGEGAVVHSALKDSDLTTGYRTAVVKWINTYVKGMTAKINDTDQSIGINVNKSFKKKKEDARTDVEFLTPLFTNKFFDMAKASNPELKVWDFEVELSKLIAKAKDMHKLTKEEMADKKYGAVAVDMDVIREIEGLNTVKILSKEDRKTMIELHKETIKADEEKANKEAK